MFRQRQTHNIETPPPAWPDTWWLTQLLIKNAFDQRASLYRYSEYTA